MTVNSIPFTMTHIVFIAQVCKIKVCNFNSRCGCHQIEDKGTLPVSLAEGTHSTGKNLTNRWILLCYISCPSEENICLPLQ